MTVYFRSTLAKYSIISFLTLNAFTFANDGCDPSWNITLASENYHFQREREGGTEQSGFIWGGRAVIERVKPYAIYYGISGLYAVGTLEGHSVNSLTLVRNKLKSRIYDSDIEGRIGYNLKFIGNNPFYITPYLGAGYFHEVHRYVRPSPLRVRFAHIFNYVSAGFNSKLVLNEEWDLGLNFKSRYMLEGKSRISDDPDPEIEEITLSIANKFHYRGELPITYHFHDWFTTSIVPFYEFRHYGRHPNYPFDFLETKIKLYGVRLNLNCSF